VRILLIVIRQTAWFLVYTLVGAIFFWAPKIILTVVSRATPHPIDDRSAHQVTLNILFNVLFQFLLALASVAGFVIVSKLRRVKAARTFCFIGASMLLGIWVLGPLAMAINTFFENGGFLSPDVWHSILFLTAIFPVSTFIGSTYAGTLFAVFLASFCLFFLAVGVPKRFFDWIVA
jgi:hypothetical protein